MKRILIIILLTLMFGCGSEQQNKDNSAASVSITPSAYNSIYYWRTIFKVTIADREFLEKYNIKKMYLRVFDVVPSRSTIEQQYSVIKPNATTIFESSIPVGVLVVPTVYITLDALKSMECREKECAELIFKRVMAMAKTNDLGPVREIQMDCDWTKSTEKSYFAFCKYMRDILLPEGIALSSTIRLHQLSGRMPEVERGTLMLYNTGSVKNAKTENSILNFDDVKTYAKNIDKIVFPLDFAYPTFSWGVRFKDNNFLALMRCDDFSNTELYRPKENGTYEVIKDHEYQGEEITKGETIRVEYSHFDEIQKVKTYIEERIKQKSYSTIIYHLDLKNLSKYNDNEIKAIYSRN